jgi:tetratricopeptide (TPR) repeat protein
MADVSSAKNMRFNAEAKDIVLLTDIKAFYKRCLTDTSIHNKYLVYKSLANIELLCGNTKDALPYLKTTIQLRPIEKSMLNHNAAEDYDNLAASFFILKDTASYEKTMKEKFAAKPAINPLLADYGCMAKIAFNHKDSIAAKKFATAGLQLSKKLPDAYICLAAINIMNGNITAAYKNADDLYNVDPKNFANYILQGICLMHDKQSSAAYTSFGMAKELVNDPEWIDNDLLKRFFTVQ